MSYETIRVDREGPLVTITLNRPERLNAMPPQMADELGQAFYDLGDEDHDMAHPQARLDRAPVQDTRRFLSEEEIRAYNRPPSTFAKIVNTRNFILLALAGGAIAAGYIFGMPLYQQYLAGKQSNDALPVITRATEEVDRFIRQNKYFPDNLSAHWLFLRRQSPCAVFRKEMRSMKCASISSLPLAWHKRAKSFL